MEPAQHQIQIFITVAVILGAIFVAVLCDYLRGSNQQLRELAVELKVRREEEQKRALLTAPPPTEAALPAAALADSKPGAAEPAPSLPAAPAGKPRAAGAPSLRAPAEQRKRTLAPEALAAMERGAQMAAAPRPTAAARPVAAAHPAAAARPAAALDTKTSVVTEAPAPVSAVTLPMPAAPASRPAAPASQKDWGALLARHAAPAHAAASASAVSRPLNANMQSRNPAPAVPVEIRQDLLDAMLAATSSQPTSQPTMQAAAAPAGAVPAGFHDGFVLSQLVQSRQPVSGLVVSIGVNAPRSGSSLFSPQVRELIQSLIGAGDFACPSGPDEFLLIYPQERGAAAQRRLSSIAQQLWDFQLRSPGEAEIRFTWGGVEVRSEPIVEAIASASERMLETRRARKLIAFEAPLKQAV